MASQCINAFPNTQDFESSATWTIGGSNSDWAWGNPSKPQISGASSGNNCWIIGGLLNSNYAGLQQSYIESPCYDFSALSCPVVSFNVFWEMEFKYDGAGLQYSINNGASWQTVGAYNDPTDCMTQNWYNHSNINYLASNSKNGWSGNSKSTSGGCQGGSGSLTWVLAKHCLGILAGKQNVRFRFVFGSGSSCNSFDGFAIDDFKIEDAVLSTNSFTNNCNTFTSIDTSCIQASSFLWNFGDPSSTTNNTSTLASAYHIYKVPGVYLVSLTKTGGTCSLNATYTKTISILGSEISSFSDVSCKGANDGAATVTPLFGNGAYSFTWSPEGGNSATTNSLSPGTHSVIVQDGIGCTATNTIEIKEPLPLITATSETLSFCAGDQIQLQINTSGISDPITYLWSPGSFTSTSIQISPTVTTVYTLNILITGTCISSEQKIFTANINPKPLISFLKPNDKGCAPYCVDLVDQSSSSTGSIAASNWHFSNHALPTRFNNSNFCFDTPGVYTGTYLVTNSFGCISSWNNALTLTVMPSPIAGFTTNKLILNEYETLVDFTDQSSMDVIKWLWNFNNINESTLKNPSYDLLYAGTHEIKLTVTNAFGCSDASIETLKVLAEFTFFAPNTFTPNEDLLNDLFLPTGSGWKQGTFKLWIFDRWGRKLFFSTDPQQGWDGKNGSNDIYVWRVELSDINNKAHVFSGNLSLLK